MRVRVARRRGEVSGPEGKMNEQIGAGVKLQDEPANYELRVRQASRTRRNPILFSRPRYNRECNIVWPAAMVGSQELPVPRRCWSIWGLLCLWEITRVFGKNNLVPTVTASFDVLEAGDMVEGCSIGFRFGFAGSNQ